MPAKENLFIENYINLTKKELYLIERYLQILQEWNKKINLTAIKDKEDIIIKHIIDSLSVLNHVDISGNMADIGSGGGFPGIPIKIKLPSIHMTLIEANRKRANFLKYAVRTLGIEGLEVYHGRVEDYDKKDFFDCAISRAFSNILNFCSVSAPLVKQGGLIIAMTGREKPLDAKQFKALGCDIHTIVSFELPNHKGYRTLVVFKKCFT